MKTNNKTSLCIFQNSDSARHQTSLVLQINQTSGKTMKTNQKIKVIK